MSQLFRLLASTAALVAALSTAAISSAQTPPPAQTSTVTTNDATRPATTTFLGDTGIWFVPIAEVLPSGQWSISGYRRGTNYVQGYTNVGDFATTFAFSVKGRAEIFGSFLVDTRIDRDTQPLFFNNATIGGIVDRYPNVTKKWSGNNLGDFYAGAKVNLLSQSAGQPLALALRGIFKLPTGSADDGVSTGKLDTIVDAIASKEFGTAVELSGYAGMEFRGSPDGFDLPKRAFRWGAGASMPTRMRIRLFAELTGTVPSSDTATITTATLLGEDLSRPPTMSQTENIARLTLGLTYQAKNGFFVGAGLSRNMPSEKRNLALASEDSFTDYTDWQFRIGFHPGVRKYVAMAPMPTPPPPAPVAVVEAPAPPAHTLSVKASCAMCAVEVGKTASVTAIATDSTNCALTTAWTAASGSFSSASSMSTPWTAGATPGTVPVTVTVTCPADGLTATDTIQMDVTRAVIKTYAFDDVYFDFDHSTLRPDALRVLDDAVAALNADPTLSLTIEGNTCNIGTAEYNLALGERRASSVRDYLVSRGVSTDRLRTVSYGEERPKFDNDREETRRLNRRAVLVVSLQK